MKRIDRLITDISAASRLDAELTRGEMDEVDIAIMLKMIVDAYTTANNHRGVEVVIPDYEAGVFIMRAIEARLGQVWRNLIDNAISFSPEGGKVTVGIKRTGSRMLVTVEDEGPGMPDGAEEKNFSRFYSERPDSEAFGAHSGLGLAICRQVVEAHGGRIGVQSEQGRGTKFILEFPVPVRLSE